MYSWYIKNQPILIRVSVQKKISLSSFIRYTFINESCVWKSSSIRCSDVVWLNSSSLVSLRCAVMNTDSLSMRLVFLLFTVNITQNCSQKVPFLPSRSLCGRATVARRHKSRHHRGSSLKSVHEWVRLCVVVSMTLMFAENGELLEGISSNAFAIIDGKVYTAPLSKCWKERWERQSLKLADTSEFLLLKNHQISAQWVLGNLFLFQVCFNTVATRTRIRLRYAYQQIIFFKGSSRLALEIDSVDVYSREGVFEERKKVRCGGETFALLLKEIHKMVAENSVQIAYPWFNIYHSLFNYKAFLTYLTWVLLLLKNTTFHGVPSFCI